NLLRLAKLELEAKDALQQFNLELRRTLKETNAAEGSYQQMTATLVRLNATYERLTEGERQSAQGRHMLKYIQELDTKLKEVDETRGKYNRNVGNYKTALQALPGPIGAVI